MSEGAMRIPDDAVLPSEKLTKYLLVPRPWDDKSKFLFRAGFSAEDPERLEAALRHAAASFDADEDGSNEYGIFYRIECTLVGPDGRSHPVVLIWLKWFEDGSFHFITLKPHKGQL